jgi:hypothetical protein
MNVSELHLELINPNLFGSEREALTKLISLLTLTLDTLPPLK